jgi:hypothetical protein
VDNGYYGPGWVGAGWYWNPWYGAYTYVPVDGIFYSPFGWGFYSPLFVFRSPVFFGHPFFHHFGPGFHPAVVGVRGGFHSERGFDGHAMAHGTGGGFAHSEGGVHGGGGAGFHGGGGGGVHGGGGGGFHGGGGGHGGR